MATEPDHLATTAHPSKADLLGYRGLLEFMPLPAYICDSEGRITYFNQKAKLLWGREPKLNDPVDSFCGSFKLFSPSGAPITHDQCWMAVTLRTGKDFNGRAIVIERPDGRRVTALAYTNPIHDESGKLVGATNVLVDITDFKKGESTSTRESSQLLSQSPAAEVERKEAETRYQELVDSVEAIVWRGDAQTRRFSYVGKQAERMLGYTVERWLSEPSFWKDHIHPEDREWVCAYCLKAIHEGRNHQLDYRMVAADGRTVWLHDVVNVISENGEAKKLTGVMVDITERKQIEADREKHHQQVLANRAQLQNLSRGLIQAHEAERRRLAGELHDEIGQVLTAVSLSLELAKGSADEAVRGRLEESMAIVNRTIDQVRSMSLNLRPAMLDVMGLESALRWFVDQQMKANGAKIDLVSSLAGKRVRPELETACFRIVQETLTNVARHARAQSVRVELTLNGTELVLSIQDDGTGFDVATARLRATTGGSFGLLGMEERVRLLGGRFEIDSALGRGTTVGVRLPLNL